MITDYASLQERIAATLNRTDLEAPALIQQAEDDLLLNEDVVQHTSRVVLVSADDVILPSDLYRIDAWYHDGPVYYGPIHIVDSASLGEHRGRLGPTGVPAYAAIEGGRARFAPVPDDAYSTRMPYWRRITRLSDANTTNWLLEEYPSIYLYAALLEAAPFLKDDERIPVWALRLQQKIDALRARNQDLQFGGTLRRQVTPIG